MKLTDIQREALDLLMNAPSSFAALYRTALQEPTLASPGVRRALADIIALGDAGFVEFALMESDGSYRAVRREDLEQVEPQYIEWLDGRSPSSISVDETSLDEIGLWMKITDRGRALWMELDDEESA